MTVKGRFQRIHRLTGFALQAFLFVTPWIQVAGHPAVQLDIPARRVYALGGVYTAADAIFLVLFLLIAVFGLFMFTALWGRLWCGYGCPQTVFLEEWVRPLETWIEGERGKRMARARDPWKFENAWRRFAKWGAFAALAGVVALTTVSWFAGARELWTGGAGVAAYTMVGVLTVGIFLDFAWFREQFCNYLCPYARFQGALSDDGSLTISYAAERGEPRGDEGACIDCKKCVAVCPQGIDIREGFQLECIACGRCIDACEGVMGKRGQPSLILYRPLKKSPTIRPRTVAYGAILTGLVLALVVAVETHEALQASVVRAPGTMFVIDNDGWTRNTYLLKVVNTSLEPEEATVQAEGLPAGAEVNVPPVHLAAAGTATVPVIVRVKDPGAPVTPLTFTVATDDANVRLAATFTAEGS
jgi:cytochrome c oxidase accessory protein FixG